MLFLFATALASPPDFCTAEPPALRVPDGPFSPPEAPARAALDAAWRASVPAVCACLPDKDKHWPASVKLTWTVSPEEGVGQTRASLPHPVEAEDRELLDCLGAPDFAFPPFAYTSDMIVDGEAAPARFVYPLVLTLRGAEPRGPRPGASPDAPDPPRHRP